MKPGGRTAGMRRVVQDTGPYSAEVEFKDHPWPLLANVNRAMGQSYKYLNRLGLS